MIDWSKLKPYQGYRWKSFEEFCYSIAKRLYHDKGNFTPIDDSGGGDGVEFYLTMPDGTEWGWQARFYYPEPRLRKSGRKTSIKNSLQRAVKNHKRLKKWFLCTPTNFTKNGEIEWFEKLQHKYPDVILEHWGDSDFNDFLTQPLMRGIKNHYFGDLELSVDWFHRQVVKQITGVGNKFIPNLHTKTPLDFYTHALLGDSVFVQHLKEQIASLKDQIAQYNKAIDGLRDKDTGFDWQDIRIKLSAFSSQLRTSLIEIIEAIVDTENYLSLGQFERIGQIDWNLMERELRERLDLYFQTVREFDPKKLPYKGTDKEAKRVGEDLQRKIMAPYYCAKETADLLFALESDIETARQQELHIFGGAGVGKTHIACHISHERISNGLPAILLLGEHFTNDLPIESQILKILDIPSSYSWEDFAEALQSAAETYKTKIPIVIDALNEAQNVGKWKRELPGFADALANLSQVVLMTTCRSNYRQAIWGQSEPQSAIEIYGFGPDSIEDAIVKYFEWYKIKCDLTLAPLRQFSNPIFLRIFCESQNRERREEKQIYLGEQTLLQVFEDYVSQCNEAVCSRLSRHPSVRIVQNALKKVARELWKRNSINVRLSDAAKLIDSQDMEHLDWPRSVTNAVLDEGLLISRDFIDGEETVLFTYNLLGGYIIAKEILDSLTPEELEGFVKSEKFNAYLLSENFSERHPLHEDILRCFALLVPKRSGKYLHQLTGNKTAFDYSVHALFEIDPELISNSSKEFIAELFSHPENREPLLKLAQTTVAHVGHPLNIVFWDKLLLELSMSERDLCWTEFVRRNRSDFFNLLDKFEVACKGTKSLTPISQQRLFLAAKLFCWLLTSTVRQLRDTATRALYWYGRRFPNRFFDLVIDSLSINDPYVPERMLAAAYGVAMALQYDLRMPEFRKKVLPTFARKLYDEMFTIGAPYATTHILSRDYAKRMVNIALIHDPQILISEEKQRLSPPFMKGGIRDWGESEEKDKEDYREGSGPIHMDFGNYTIGRLVPNRRNYDFDNEDYKKVRANILWRMYDLQYSHDLFREMDKEIHRHNWTFGRSANGGKIDRYGKKYSWIAFYELAGYRRDNGLLPAYSSNRLRISDADIDPSFPQSPQKYEVIKSDYLGDRSIDLPEWIQNGGVPDLTPYLIVEKLCDEYGPWVLLDGYINQEDLEAKRARFIFPRGLLVKKDKASELVECLKNQNLGGRWLPEIPEDHYTYAGEIPWCETFPHNGTTKIDFVVGSRIERVPEKGVARLRDGTVLTIDELLGLLLEKKDLVSSKESIETLLDKEGIEQIETTVYRDKEIKETTSFEALIPVRYYSWEDYHSTVNKAAPAMVLAKELAEALDLCSQPQTFDLYEKNGKRASITLGWGEPWYTEHHLTYLRQDLLERYLKENDAELVWAIWGEREFRSKNVQELVDFSKEHESHRVFQVIKTYSQIRKSKTA